MSLRSESGFTLLEIIVALAIAAAGIAAVAKYTASAAEVSYQTEERMLAVWVAGNRLSELRVGRAWPAPGSYQHQTTMGQRTWYINETVSDTDLRDLRRVEVAVYTDPDRTTREFSLYGYVARYVPPEKKQGPQQDEEGAEDPGSETPQQPDDGSTRPDEDPGNPPGGEESAEPAPEPPPDGDGGGQG